MNFPTADLFDAHRLPGDWLYSDEDGIVLSEAALQVPA